MKFTRAVLYLEGAHHLNHILMSSNKVPDFPTLEQLRPHTSYHIHLQGLRSRLNITVAALVSLQSPNVAFYLDQFIHEENPDTLCKSLFFFLFWWKYVIIETAMRIRIRSLGYHIIALSFYPKCYHTPHPSPCGIGEIPCFSAQFHESQASHWRVFSRRQFLHFSPVLMVLLRPADQRG